MGNAAKRGILIKGGQYLELAGNIDVLVFDKTGTLTAGIPRVSRVVTLDEEKAIFVILINYLVIRAPHLGQLTL